MSYTGDYSLESVSSPFHVTIPPPDSYEYTPVLVNQGLVEGQYPPGFYTSENSRCQSGITFKILFDSLPLSERDQTLTNLGFIKYLPVYQAVGDPTASGEIDLVAVENWCRIKIGSIVPDETYIMVDFENPYFDHLYNYPTDSEEFIQSTNQLVSVIDLLKTIYPNAKIGHYGIPVMHFWHSFLTGTDPPEKYNRLIHGPPDEVEVDGPFHMGNLSEAQLESVLDHYYERNSAVMDALDWINPSLYDRYDVDFFPNSGTESFRLGAYNYAYYNIELVQRFKNTTGSTAEIIPAISAMYWKVGQLEYNMKQVPISELFLDQVDGSIGHTGCDGLAFWHGMAFWVPNACQHRDEVQEGENGYGQYVKWLESREAFTKDYFGGITPDWEGYYTPPNNDD